MPTLCAGGARSCMLADTRVCMQPSVDGKWHTHTHTRTHTHTHEHTPVTGCHCVVALRDLLGGRGDRVAQLPEAHAARRVGGRLRVVEDGYVVVGRLPDVLQGVAAAPGAAGGEAGRGAARAASKIMEARQERGRLSGAVGGAQLANSGGARAICCSGFLRASSLLGVVQAPRAPLAAEVCESVLLFKHVRGVLYSACAIADVSVRGCEFAPCVRKCGSGNTPCGEEQQQVPALSPAHHP